MRQTSSPAFLPASVNPLSVAMLVVGLFANVARACDGAARLRNEIAGEWVGELSRLYYGEFVIYVACFFLSLNKIKWVI